MSNIVDKKQDAFNTHARILAAAATIIEGTLKLGKNAKKMRDEKLYIELGFETFDDYTKSVLNIGERQAYNYIRVFEKYPPQQLERYAELEVTKLGYLIDIPVTERDEFIETTGIENLKEMTTREVKELVEKNTIQAEQIEMLGIEVSKLEEKDKLKDNFEVKFKKEKELKEKLEKQVNELKNKPVDVAVFEPTFEDLEKIKSQTKAELKEVFEKEKQDAVLKAEVEMKSDLEVKYKNQIETLENKNAEALERAEKLVKENKLTADPNTVKIMAQFDILQDAYLNIESLLRELDSDQRIKISTAINGFVDGKKL